MKEASFVGFIWPTEVKDFLVVIGTKIFDTNPSHSFCNCSSIFKIHLHGLLHGYNIANQVGSV
jgi:hypothetical protein